MKKLILTNLENHSHLKPGTYDFLGPWCLMGGLEQEEKLNFVEFTPLFYAPAEMKKASEYVLNFSSRLILELTRELNNIHNRNYSLNFWSILLMPSVVSLIQAWYERHLHLQKFLSANNNGVGYEVDLINFSRLPKIIGTSESMKFTFIPEGNHYLFSILLNGYKECGIKLNTNIHRFDVDVKTFVDNRNGYLKIFKRKLLKSISTIFAKLSGIYLESIPGMSTWDQLDLCVQLAFKKRPEVEKKDLKDIIPKSIKKYHKPCDFFKLINFSQSVKLDEFEKLVSKELPRLLPEAFTKNFYENEYFSRNFVERLGLRVTKFVLGPLLGGANDPMKFIVGLHKEQGGKLYLSQHGANYGTALSFPYVTGTEYANADSFITWGWKKQGDLKVNAVPLPSPMLSKFCNCAASDDKGKLILVSTLIKLYTNKLTSNPQPAECYGFREAKLTFINSLPVELKENLLYRPYFREDDGISDMAYIKKKFTNIKVFKGQLNKILPNIRCAVIDHPGTTMNISMAMNTPTVAFWNREQWAMCDEADKVYTKLHKVGIVHYDPKSAAQLIEEKWYHLKDWWNSNEIQEARSSYCDNFSRFDKNWKNLWVEYLNE